MTRELADVDDVLADLPPSAKYVYHVLEEEDDDRLSRQDLLDRVHLNERTLDRALNHLQNVGYVDKTRDSDDLRQVVVTL
jgi:DNA-binding MarR family transcriptional regulator